MKPPYFILHLKADLDVEDCVQFINSVTEEGKKSFKNLFIALPFSRLEKMVQTFPDSGMQFGVPFLNDVNPKSFTEEISVDIVKEAGGHFALVASQEERKVEELKEEQILAKLQKGLESDLKMIYCIFGETLEELQGQLRLLKEANILAKDPHPLIIYELPFDTFAAYLPSQQELQVLAELAKKAVTSIFEKESAQIAILAKLPYDLAGFSSLIDAMPFDGAFFIKSGIYPHAVHQENVRLFHVNCCQEMGK